MQIVKRGTAMCYCSDSAERIITAVKRTLMILVFFTAVFVFSGSSAFAEDGPLLTVSIDGETVKTYMTTEELTSIPDAVTGPVDYSGYNSYPTFSVKHVDSGVKLERIINDACGKESGELDSSSVIKLKAPDGVATSLTIGQLFGQVRYYYPNAVNGTDNKGGRALPEAYEYAVEVPAVIDLSDDNTFMFGQTAPNEQNLPEFMKYMLGATIKGEQKPGEIEITTAPAEKCSEVTKAVPASGSNVKDGTAVSLPLPSKAEKRTKIYYIVDPAEGEEPGAGCDFYYYSPFNWSGDEEDLKEYINPPVIRGTGRHTIAVKVCAYGKQDSGVSYLEYTVLPAAPSRPVIKLAPGKKKITVRWKKVTGANGYVIYRSTKKSSGYKAVRTIKKGNTVSFTNKNLKRGKRYYYKVCAYKIAYGTKVFSKYSSVKSTKTK